MNTFGRLLRMTTFGESHGPAIGVILDGYPAGVVVDAEAIQAELHRRRPGQSAITTQRKENDLVQIVSGVYEGRSTGAPIMLLIANEDARPQDYSAISEGFRPNHADYTYAQKYGHRDPRGGGRSSARETAARVAAGALAKQWLRVKGVDIKAWVSQVGKIKLTQSFEALDLSIIDANPVRCPHAATAKAMLGLIEQVQAAGDTIGGTITCLATGLPVGLGAPVYAKLHAELGAAMLSINAVKGFDYGWGFDGLEELGSSYADAFEKSTDGQWRTSQNASGGIQGGISNGMPIYMRVAFKPVATLMREVETLDHSGNPIVIPPKGRHDPCVLPRAVPIVEAMAALVLMDHWLLAGA